MKTGKFSATVVIVLAIALLCTGICAWQTVNLISHQNVFSADHPDYVPHSWYLLGLLTVTAVLGVGQLVLRRKRALCGALSVVMIVLESLALRAAAGQHYNMGMLISDYGISVPFEGGWLLLILAVALIIATVAQLLILLFSVGVNSVER